jgi:hypothetical protein
MIFTFFIRTISSKRSTVGPLSQCRLSKLTLHLAVEYRLLQHAPVPGALQDAAAVYAHLVTQRLGARRSLDGKYRYPKLPTSDRTHARDTTTMPDPVLGISENMGQTLDHETRLRSSTTPAGTEISPSGDTGHRQHVETIREDDRRDSVEPLISGNDASPVNTMHLTQAERDAVAAARRPRIILIGDSAGGNLVLALARWVRDEGILPVPDGMILLSPSCDPCTHRLHGQWPRLAHVI